MITKLNNQTIRTFSTFINKLNKSSPLPISSTTTKTTQKVYFSTSDELRLKTKIPVFRQNDENVEHLSIGKLKESDHSVALVNLEFIKIDSIVNLSADELSRLVVIPKTEKVSPEHRIEKLENEIKQLRESLDRLLPKSHNTSL